MVKRAFIKKVLVWLLFGLLVASGLFLWWTGRPLTQADADRQIQSVFRRASQFPDRQNAALLIYNARTGHKLSLKAPQASPAFHAASAAKLLTTALIGRLIDQGKLGLDSRVEPILGKETLSGLFTAQGQDSAAQVTIGQLLGHTSGAADYFEDKNSNGQNLFDLLVSQPQTRWSPRAILRYTRDHLHPIGPPGQQYHYSDTGFVLLGLVIEKLYGKTLPEVIDEQITRPLGMRHTWMPFRDQPAQSTVMGPAWVKGQEISQFPSMTADWAGGGVASTPDDLLKFSQALSTGQLVSRSTLQTLSQFNQRFMPGIRYGYGLMEYHFAEFMPLLGSYPKLQGHMGILGVQVFHDPEHDTYYVLNLGSTAAVEDSVRLLIQVVGLEMRVQ